MAVNITYFVHGTTIDNENKKCTGWLPGKLSEKGINQVKELKKIINIDDYDVVITSDLTRAIDSTKILFENEDLIYLDNRLRECNYGELNGKDSSLVNYYTHISETFPNGESLKDVEKRMTNFCKYLINYYDNKNVAIVAHKAPQLALDVLTKDMTWEEAIKNDWRITKDWKPGWNYTLNNLKDFKNRIGE